MSQLGSSLQVRVNIEKVRVNIEKCLTPPPNNDVIKMKSCFYHLNHVTGLSPNP